ncbi:hypothetical protein CT3_20100 [Comamonas terrigena NBRC 13299]|nr:hypothetical protein CT3_20100 [Comamonas terrigena NBRC 13299]
MFQIHMRDMRADGYGCFTYSASNKVILQSNNIVNAYDEIYSQMDVNLIRYGQEDFSSLANEIIKNTPLIVYSGSDRSFENLSVQDKLFMIDAIYGAKQNNPLFNLELEDASYEIRSLNDKCFPAAIFDLSSSKYNILGPFIYKLGGVGKIIWGCFGEFFEVDINLSYFYAVYYKAAEIINLKMNTWKFSKDFYENSIENVKCIPVEIDGDIFN